jgi:hypothetical protein
MSWRGHPAPRALGLCTLLALLASAGEGRAESSTANRAKGVAGGAIAGSEVVMLTEAAIGVQASWLYVVGGVVGAGGGGVAGYYIGGSASPKPPSFLLAGSIALVIPTLIGVVTATSFQPPDNYRPERSPDEDAPADARLELPSVEIARTFSDAEVHMFRVTQATELHLSLLRGVF